MNQQAETNDTLMPQIARLPELLRTQDNRITQNPIFVVQKRVKDFGFDSEYSDEYEWYDVEDNETAGEEEAKKLDELESSMESTYPWGKVYVKERWQFVQPFFTEKSAQEYIDSNKHNLGECRIFVESGYRNHEWESVREYFKTTRPDAKDSAAEVVECEKCKGYEEGTHCLVGIAEHRDIVAELATVTKERDEAVELLRDVRKKTDHGFVPANVQGKIIQFLSEIDNYLTKAKGK